MLYKRLILHDGLWSQNFDDIGKKKQVGVSCRHKECLFLSFAVVTFGDAQSNVTHLVRECCLGRITFSFPPVDHCGVIELVVATLIILTFSVRELLCRRRQTMVVLYLGVHYLGIDEV